jgi:hypothetical protein
MARSTWRPLQRQRGQPTHSAAAPVSGSEGAGRADGSESAVAAE